MDRFLIFGVLALILNIIGYIPYVKGILDGKVKPHRVTWGIWSVLTLITFINQIVNDGKYSLLFLGSTTALVISVFLLSIRKGTGGATKFDLSILIASIILFVYWILVWDTRNST